MRIILIKAFVPNFRDRSDSRDRNGASGTTYDRSKQRGDSEKDVHTGRMPKRGKSHAKGRGQGRGRDPRAPSTVSLPRSSAQSSSSSRVSGGGGRGGAGASTIGVDTSGGGGGSGGGATNDDTMAKATIPPDLEERLLAVLLEHHPTTSAVSHASPSVLKLRRAYDELTATGLPPEVSSQALLHRPIMRDRAYTHVVRSLFSWHVTAMCSAESY